MPKTLSEQKFCGWCGSKVTYKTEWMSECPNCGYKRYINPNPCCNVIITKGDSVLMVKRAIQPQQGKYDLPGGFMDMTDSTIEDATYRELLEEMGLPKNSVSELVYMGSAMSPYEWQGVSLNNICFFFKCELLKQSSDIKLDKNENSEMKWITKTDLPNIDLAWDIDRQMLNKLFEDI